MRVRLLSRHTLPDPAEQPPGEGCEPSSPTYSIDQRKPKPPGQPGWAPWRDFPHLTRAFSLFCFFFNPITSRAPPTITSATSHGPLTAPCCLITLCFFAFFKGFLLSQSDMHQSFSGKHANKRAHSVMNATGTGGGTGTGGTGTRRTPSRPLWRAPPRSPP